MYACMCVCVCVHTVVGVCVKVFISYLQGVQILLNTEGRRRRRGGKADRNIFFGLARQLEALLLHLLFLTRHLLLPRINSARYLIFLLVEKAISLCGSLGLPLRSPALSPSSHTSPLTLHTWEVLFLWTSQNYKCSAVFMAY